MSRSLHKPMIAVLVCIALSRLSSGQELPENGDVVVISPRARLMRGTDVVAEVSKGQLLDVTELRGDWIGVHFRGKGAWIKSSDVFFPKPRYTNGTVWRKSENYSVNLKDLNFRTGYVLDHTTRILNVDEDGIPTELEVRFDVENLNETRGQQRQILYGDVQLPDVEFFRVRRRETGWDWTPNIQRVQGTWPLSILSLLYPSLNDRPTLSPGYTWQVRDEDAKLPATVTLVRPYSVGRVKSSRIVRCRLERLELAKEGCLHGIIQVQAQFMENNSLGVAFRPNTIASCAWTGGGTVTVCSRGHDHEREEIKGQLNMSATNGALLISHTGEFQKQKLKAAAAGQVSVEQSAPAPPPPVGQTASAKQPDVLSAEDKLSLDRLSAGSTCRIAIVLNIQDGWHINQNPKQRDYLIPTSVSLKAKLGSRPRDLKYPQGQPHQYDGADTTVLVYKGRVVVFGTLEVPIEAGGKMEELEWQIHYQATANGGLPPTTLKFTRQIEVAPAGEKVNTINDELFNPPKPAP